MTCAQCAEDAGAESVWVSEAWGRDAFLALAAIASVTQHIKLGTGIVNVFSRSPATLAMAAITLDELSEGRAILGLGTSGSRVIERWHGLRYDLPITRIKETITIVRQIFAGDKVNFEGTIFHVGDFRLAIEPRRRRIPIYLATLGIRMLKLAGATADGALLYLCPPPKIPDRIREIREGATATGKPSEEIDIAAFLPTHVSMNPEEARAVVRQTIAFYVGGMGTYYHSMVARSGFTDEANKIQDAWQQGDKAEAVRSVSDSLLDSVAMAGSIAECRVRLEEFRKAGLKLPILSFSVRNQKDTERVCETIKALII